jgi:hypothetical protein
MSNGADSGNPDLNSLHPDVSFTRRGSPPLRGKGVATARFSGSVQITGRRQKKKAPVAPFLALRANRTGVGGGGALQREGILPLPLFLIQEYGGQSA